MDRSLARTQGVRTTVGKESWFPSSTSALLGFLIRRTAPRERLRFEPERLCPALSTFVSLEEARGFGDPAAMRGSANQSLQA